MESGFDLLASAYRQYVEYCRRHETDSYIRDYDQIIAGWIEEAIAERLL